MRLLLEVSIILYQIHLNSKQNRKTWCYKLHGSGCPWVKMIYRKDRKDRKAQIDKLHKKPKSPKGQIDKLHKKDKKDPKKQVDK